MTSNLPLRKPNGATGITLTTDANSKNNANNARRRTARQSMHTTAGGAPAIAVPLRMANGNNGQMTEEQKLKEIERVKEQQLRAAQQGTPTVYSAPAAVSRVISGGLPSPSDTGSRNEHKTPQRPASPSPLPKISSMNKPAANGSNAPVVPSRVGSSSVINLRAGTPGSPAVVSQNGLPSVPNYNRGLSVGRPESADILSPVPGVGILSKNPARMSISGGIGLVQTRPTSPNGTQQNVPIEDSPLQAWSSSPHGKTNNLADEKDADWEELDTRVLDSPTWRELYRIVRMCSIQPSCHWMVRKLEEELRELVHADLVHVYLVKRDGFRREGRSYPLGEGITGYVHKRKDIVNITEPTRDARYTKGVDSTGDGTTQPTAFLCLPVEADHRADCSGTRDVVAIFQAFKMTPGAMFSSKDARVLYRLGEFAGNMLRTSSKLDQAQALYNQSLTTHQRSSALLDVAKVLASETKLDSIVSIIVRQVPELLDCDRCTLYFVDRQRDQLIVTRGASQGRKKTLVSWIFGQSNAPELPFEPGQTQLRFPIDKGIAGTVATTGEVLNIVDCHQDKRFNSTMDGLTGYRTRSMVCVPMVDSKGVIIGVVQAVNKNPLYPRFDQEDEVVLKTFAAQAALAVRNAELFAKTESALLQSDAMLEVTTALSKELNIGTLIKIIVSKVQQLLEADRCTVYIVDQEKKELYTSDAMSYGMGPALPIDKNRAKMIHFPMDRGIAGGVATTGITCNIKDAYADDRFNKTMDLKTGFRTRSILCMAIRNHRSEVVGVLQVMNKKIGYVFDDNDEKLLAAFSAQAAVAIENSRLFQQTEKALNHALADQRNLKFMLAVTKNLFSDMHLTSMIDQMTMQVHHLLKADDCALYLVDEKTREFYLAKDDSMPGMRRFPFTTGIVGVVASAGSTIRISRDAHRDPRFAADVDQRKDKTTHSILCCPIKAEGPDDKTSIIGVISVRDEKDRGGFEQEEEKLLKVFCAQAAVGIMNARRFANIMEQSEYKGDHSAADFLRKDKGFRLASEDIEPFMFKMEDIVMKGAIGTGSYGEVFRATVKDGKGDPQLVAVKKLHVRNLKAEQVEAFCNEASLMCQLDHPNVVGFIGAVTEPQNLCIITQYCAKGSLADLLLEESIEMSFELKMKFARDAARGMLYLHSSNPTILHRDLKSDNLLVASDWTVKVADFGLTRFLNEKKAMTQVGTPMWMAPEIIMGRKYTEKADVYAFGIILWEILTRLEPYEDKEPMQIVVEVVNDDLRPDLPDIYRDNPLVPLMKDCWATDPASRPSFRVIVDRLESIPVAGAKPNAAPNQAHDEQSGGSRYLKDTS